ncbi:guanylate-binding protein 2-like, partial [Ruditapes philippinarum]|uniref:guanylate-binding protein 2-like n=1 Tax=Ruditapes philippinarum TaxID=129788 RepID=UPI00295ACDD9
MSENLKVSATDTTDNNFDLLMPDFVLCIRDFTLDLEIDGKECSEDDYFEHCLKGKKTENSKLDEAYNRPRLCIKKYFTKRKAFTFDRPASRKAMKNLEQAKEENLSDDFVNETKKFIAYVYERPAKMLQNKKLVTGRMLLELLNAFVKAIKNGTVPCIDDALTVMSKQENERHAKDAIASFRGEIGKLSMPFGNKTQLLEKKFSTQSLILTGLNSKLLLDDNHAKEMEVKVKYLLIFEDDVINSNNIKGLKRRLREDEMDRGIGMLEAGPFQRPVAHVLGVSKSVDIPGCGTDSKRTENVLQGLAEVGKRSTTQSPGPIYCPSDQAPNRSLNATTLRNDFQNVTGVVISTQTVRNRLNDAGLRSRRPAICIPLNQRHIQERLQWAQSHVTWTVNDWTPVLFTDESMFCLDFMDRRVR